MTDEDTGTRITTHPQTRFRERAWPRGLGLGGGGDVSPRMDVRARRAYGDRGGESEGGVHLRCGQAQRPFLGMGDAPGVAVS